jgi:hypothetical protein
VGDDKGRRPQYHQRIAVPHKPGNRYIPGLKAYRRLTVRLSKQRVWRGNLSVPSSVPTHGTKLLLSSGFAANRQIVNELSASSFSAPIVNRTVHVFSFELCVTLDG